MPDENTSTPGGAREPALAESRQRREFHRHLAAYVVVNAAVWLIWAVTAKGYPWPAWLTTMWAMGLAVDGWEACVRRPLKDADAEPEIGRLRATH
jgi:hypothetical protein